jgi:cytochrome c oxidase cbb3-type subunit 3
MKLKKTSLFIFSTISLMSMETVLAQTATNTPAAIDPQSFGSKFPHYFEDPLVLLGFFVLLIVCLSLYSLYETVEALYGKKKIEEEVIPQVDEVKKESLWSKIMKGLTRSVPVEQEADVMLDHNYDGIRELDNRLPPWWIWGFYVTIVFAVVYLLSFHVAGTAKLSLAEYQEEMDNAKKEREERMKNSAENITLENVTLLTDAGLIASGKQTFEKLCVTCHGNAGQGNVGPNLTDDFWLNGGGIKNVFHTITEGVPAKGMISWKSQLTPLQIQQVSSFILTLHGTNPEGAKDPQGEKWVEVAKTDTVAPAKTDTLKKS